jgi:hypothetical protein
LKLLNPLVAWAVALCTLAGAVHELRLQRDAADARAALAALPRLAVASSPTTMLDHQAIQKKTAVFGTVELVPGPTTLVIKAAALSDYAAWRLAVDQVLLDNPGIRWHIDSLCTGQCATGESHKAVLSGRRMSVKLESKADDAMPVHPVVSGNS